MGQFLLKAVFGIILAGSLMIVGTANGQAEPSQNAVVSSPDVVTKSNDGAHPPEDSSDIVLDPARLLPDLPSLPRAKASLIGGTVERLDRVRDLITVQVFGGGKLRIAFDPRTRIVRDGVQASASDLHRGDRIYVDTILDGSSVFARTIRLKPTTAGESQGTVMSYRVDKGELMIRDALSPQPVKVRLTSQTRVTASGRPVSAGELQPGTLVAVAFGQKQNGIDVAQEVSVLAVPGDSFTFSGVVTAVDLRLGLLVLTSSTDHKTYEISLDPSLTPVGDDLRPGADVTVFSLFDGSRYVARSVSINSRIQP